MSKNADNSADYNAEAEGFYSRWSKRKVQNCSSRLAEEQSESLTNVTPSLDTTVDQQIFTESNQEKVQLCDKDMPDLDSLDEDSDYSGFLSPGVSEGLRKLALRKLFQGQSFNLCDGLDDYDEEFTSFEKLGDIITADMRFQLEEEAKRKLQMAVENEDISDKSDDLSILDEAYSEDDINESAGMDEDSRKALAGKEHSEEHKIHNNENLS